VPGTNAADRALAAAVLCRGLKLGLEPPGAALVQTLGSVEGRAALRVAAGVLDGAGGGPVLRALSALLDTATPRPAALAEEYGRLFGHSLRGKICPYETEYGAAALLQQSHQLADIEGGYAAFGVRVASSSHERADHVACEIEFLELMSLKEAWALDAGDTEMAEITARALRRFLGDHLGRFGHAFARSLRAAAGEGFYARLGDLCAEVLAAICTHREVALGSPGLELRPWEDDGAPMACGSVEDGGGESELVPLGGRGSS
jgi:TorA maturation chaperone TorD